MAHLVIAPLPTATAVSLLIRRPRTALTFGFLQGLAAALGLRSTGIPPSQSWRWTTRWDLWWTLVGLGRVATMFGLPALTAAVFARRTRMAATALLTAVPATEFVTRRPGVNPIGWLLACVADDFAYGIGVLTGCLRTRTAGPLRPRLVKRTAIRRHSPGAEARTSEM